MGARSCLWGQGGEIWAHACPSPTSLGDPASWVFVTLHLPPPHPSLSCLMTAELTFALQPQAAFSNTKRAPFLSWSKSSVICHDPQDRCQLLSVGPAPSPSGPYPLSSCLHSAPRVHGAPACTGRCSRCQGTAVGMRHTSHSSGPERLLLGLCTHHAVPSASPAVLSGPFLLKMPPHPLWLVSGGSALS